MRKTWWHKYLFAMIGTTIIASGIYIHNHYYIRYEGEYTYFYCLEVAK